MEETYEALKAILKPYAPAMIVSTDNEDAFMLETRFAGPNSRRLFFAGVRRGKAYISFHLVPLYTHPRLLDRISADLRKRMQGKACFNFRAPDSQLFARLRALAKEAYDIYSSPTLMKKMLEAYATSAQKRPKRS